MNLSQEWRKDLEEYELALRFGLPQLIIPHIVDQFLWMKLVHKAGFGPLGFPIKKWNKDRINDAILALLQFV